MTSPSSSRRDKTSSFTKLFSGVSAAALFLGVFGGTARAVGTTITNTVSAVSVTTGQSFDFIDIDGGTVTNDVTNNGTVGLSTTTNAIYVHGGGTVGGMIVNGTDGEIYAQQYGIRVSGDDPVSTIQNDGLVSVQSTATGTTTFALVRAIYYQGSTNGSDLSSTISNNGTIVAGATVLGATLSATAEGVNQDIFNVGDMSGSNISGSFANGGELTISAAASGTDFMLRNYGVRQHIFLLTTAAAGDLSISQTNSGSVNLSANASGTGDARSIGLLQGIILGLNSSAGNAALTVTNSGLLSLNLSVNGSNIGPNATGIFQYNSMTGASSIGDLTFSAVNSGTIDNNLNIQGASTTFAGRALGIFQLSTVQSASSSGNLDFDIVNSGSLTVQVNATGNNAQVRGTALEQFQLLTSLSSGGDIDFAIVNSGDVDVMVQAAATGPGTQNIGAIAFGAYQAAMATTGANNSFSFTNGTSGNLSAGASASVVGTSSAVKAVASAFANGIAQSNNSANQPTANFNIANSGSLTFSAMANASGAVTSNTATAVARGYRVRAGGANQTAVLNVGNSGSLNVNATANATNAVASASGMVFRAAVLTGTVSNAGTLNVTASAPSGSAHAVGVQFNGDVNNVTFTNTGDIHVLAIGSTTATGIGFGPSTAFTNTIMVGTSDVATLVNNGGSITAWVNSGGTLDYGNAINTLGAPNPVMIDLQGGGSIVGNILISDDDSIVVNNGATFYEGMINGASTFDGSLWVGSTGTFSLAVGSVSSEAQIYVNSYTQTSTGTLSFDIDASTIKLGQINAITADLDGTVHINIAPGLYDDFTFESVIVADTLTGTWSGVTTNTNSAFLSFAAQYPGDDTADIALSRAAFNSLGGLTQNQMSVATGIENSYSTGLTGDYGMLVQDLLFMDATSYQNSIEQLHGAEHAQNMHSLLYSFQGMNAAISDRVNVGPYWTRSGQDVIHRGDMAFWASANKGWGNNDGDVEAPGFDQNTSSFYAGFDFAPSTTTVFGLAAGYYKNELEFDNGNRKEDDGIQLALYGYHDVKDWYLRGVAGYGTYDAESSRAISVGSTVGTALGTYDVKVLSFEGEIGHRIEVSPRTFITPFATLGYADVKMDPFTETGAGGANLSFAENSVSAWMGDLGIRFSTARDVGGGGLFIPEFSIAYQHNFGDETISLNTGFAGVANSGFSVIGSEVSSGSVVANLGLTLATSGGMEIKGEYNGRFNGEYQMHSAGIRITVLFGN